MGANADIPVRLLQILFDPRRRQWLVWGTAIILLLIAVFSWFLPSGLQNWTRHHDLISLQRRIRITAAAVLPSQISQIPLTPTALRHPAWQQTAQMLRRIRRHDPELRDVFLLAVRPDQLQMLIDATPTDQNQGVQVGSVFNNPPAEINEAIVTGKTQMLNAVTQRAGECIAAYVPITDTRGRTVAVLCLAYDRSSIDQRGIQAWSVGLFITALLIGLTLVLLWIRAQSDNLKLQKGQLETQHDQLARQRDELAVKTEELTIEVEERKRLEEEAKLSAMEIRKLALVAERTDNAVLIANRQGKVEWINEAFIRQTGYPLQDIMGKKPGNVLFGPKTDRNFRREMDKSVNQLKQSFSGEVICHTREGDPYWAYIEVHAIYDESGKAHCLLFIHHDITERKKREQHLEHKAHYDALTALPNRIFFMQALQEAFAKPLTRRSEQFAVLFCDLDGFKQINDTLGHDAGDQTLIEFARRLQTCVREGDIVARLAGDEFTCLLHNITCQDEALIVAQRIVDAMAQPIQLGNQQAHPSTSIGVALSNPNYHNPDDLLADADTAMYKAKHGGKNRFVLFKPMPPAETQPSH